MCNCGMDHDVAKSQEYSIMIEDIDYVLSQLRVPIEKALNPLKAEDFLKLEARLAAKLRSASGELVSEVASSMKDLAQAVDLDNPKSLIDFVNGSKDLLKRLPVETAKDLTPIMRESISDMYKMTKVRQLDLFYKSKGIGAKAAINAKDKAQIALMNKNQSIYIKAGVRNQVANFTAGSKKIFADALEHGWSRKQVEKELMNKFGNTVGDKSYWNVVSSAQLNRTRNWAKLESYRDAGLDEYEILAVMDERTSKVCREMNGKRFSVKKQIGIMEEVAKNPDRDYLVERTPWLSERKGEDGQTVVGIKREGTFTPLIDGGKLLRSEESLQNSGVGLPPYHGLCRTTVVSV